MSPDGNDLFWRWKAIYEELQDPITEVLGDRYFPTILETQFNYCKKQGAPIGIAILDIQNLPNYKNRISTLEAYLLIRNITNIIKKGLTQEDMVFYDGNHTFSFLFPRTNKGDIQKIVYKIEMDLEKIYQNDIPLVIKGGYAGFPVDANDPLELQECARKALIIANKSINNRIVGYFPERRKNPRIPLQIEVRFLSPNSPEHLTCSRNISETGIMLSGIPDLPLGDEIKLIFNLPKTTQSTVTILAKTIWNKISLHTGKMDVGLRFVYINDTVKSEIRRFIAGIHPPVVHP